MSGNTETGKGPTELMAALEYAARGWSVFPVHTPSSAEIVACSCRNPICRSPGKHPRTPRGFKDASTDAKQIKHWWDQWPTANVGIATGNGLLVLDVDPRNGGMTSLEELEKEHGPIRTRKVRTGSGGWHFYFKTTDPIRGRSGVRLGLDIKADGGYVVAPPSIHVEGQYVLVDDCEPALAPQWVLDLIGGSSDLGDASALTDGQLERYAAPGDTAEDRVRFTQLAVAKIPNEGDFDDRHRWIKMAHAIRASCGTGLEDEAFEIFDDFSRGWGDGYDHEETRRVWDTLPSSTSPGGHRWIVSRAYRDDPWQMPSDHPWRADNVFEADPELAMPVGQPRSERFRLALKKTALLGVDMELLPEALEHVHDSMSGLSSRHKSIVEAKAITKLKAKVGSPQEARRVLQSFAPTRELGAFAKDEAGTPQLRRLDARAIRAVVPYLVEGRIPVASVGTIIAGYSRGKTWLTIDLAMSVAFGRPWLGCRTMQNPVIFLIAEGHHGFLDRLFGWLVEHELLSHRTSHEELATVLGERIVINQHPPRFDEPDFEEGLINAIEQYRARLVVIDTLGKTLGPGQIENDNDVANTVTGMLSRIAAQTGCTTLFTHHTGHSDDSRGRGASAWEQGLEFSYVIKGTLEEFRRGRPMALTAHKMRDAPLPPPVGFRLQKLPGLFMAEGDGRGGRDVSSAVIQLDTTPAAGLPLAARVFLFIRDVPGSCKGDVRSNVSGKHEVVDQALVGLIQLGAVGNDGSGNRHSYSALPGWRVDHEGEVVEASDDFSPTPESPADVDFSDLDDQDSSPNDDSDDPS